MKSRQFKLVSAGIGASAAIAMSVVGVGINTVSAQAPLPLSPVATPQPTVGETVTKSKAPSAPQVRRAEPAIKGPAPLPPEEQGLPG
ncbi:hypothetical protein [Mycolicibacterium agri]|uniref:hypothetical protein n=1 Tax=Mycolicibacterium agri TaxID=36811 RepID=UPI001055FBF6|nr:hypothetical protein [Mycolicibacterium agri]